MKANSHKLNPQYIQLQFRAQGVRFKILNCSLKKVKVKKIIREQRTGQFM